MNDKRESKTNCENCIHDAVCRLKEDYYDLMEHVWGATDCESPNFNVCVYCKHFEGKFETKSLFAYLTGKENEHDA